MVLDESCIPPNIYFLLLYTLLSSHVLGSEDGSDLDNQVLLFSWNFQFSGRDKYVNK